jgi:uncharacterized membrane protein
MNSGNNIFQITLLRSLKAISKLEHTVMDESLKKGLPFLTNLKQTRVEVPTLGQRMADHVATFGGSWVFIGYFGSFPCGLDMH